MLLNDMNLAYHFDFDANKSQIGQQRLFFQMSAISVEAY